MAPKDRLGLSDSQDSLGDQAPQDRLGIPVNKVLQARMVLQVLQDLQAPLDRRDHQAPLMEIWTYQCQQRLAQLNLIPVSEIA